MTPRQGTGGTEGPEGTDGTVLGDRYTLTERIAMGGMGEVWAATDTVLGRTVAVKLMHPALGQEHEFVERFRAEARHTAALDHPNITTVFDYGEDGGASYVVMELVAGKPLSRLISERAPLSAAETASLLGQAASALEAAHRGGVVHRDVKPANILVTPGGTVKLTDFGISHAVDAASLTQAGQVLGTAQYLSPEQALGQGATAASDIYALGVIGYEMLTGQRPFDADNPVATALAQVNQPAPPLPEAVPVGIRDVISACLAKDPADRPASAEAVALALASQAALASGAPLASGAVAGAPAAWLPTPAPGQAAATGTAPTQAMPAQAIANGPPGLPGGGAPGGGLPGRRSGRRPAWLLGAAAAAVVAVMAVFALSDALSDDGSNGGGTTPVATTTAPNPNPNPSPNPSPTPSSSATARVEPPAPNPPVPRRDNKGKGNRDDDKKEDK